jgi:sugar phosphate isomerase/epimerase
MNHPTTRRNFLRTSAALAAGVTFAPRIFGQEKKQIPIGVQLYSVRNEIKADFPGTIEKIGKMGYKAVEFASLQERQMKAKDLRKLLDDNGLKCCGTHTPLPTLQGDGLKATIDLHKELGNTFLICPSMQGKTAENWMNLAKQFNDIAAKCKEQGMFTGYHAHAGDMKKPEGSADKTIWEIFFDNTNADVIHQIDVGNTMSGGGDPIALMKKYPGRTKSLHMKEHGGEKGAAIGEGKVDWPTLINVCQTVAGTEYYIVEYESADPLNKLKTCHDNLKKLAH